MEYLRSNNGTEYGRTVNVLTRFEVTFEVAVALMWRESQLIQVGQPATVLPAFSTSIQYCSSEIAEHGILFTKTEQ